MIGISTVALAQTAPLPPEAKVAGTSATAHPEIWPAYKYPVAKDAKAEAMIASLLKRMTLEEKIGQLVQGDISAITPADMQKYHLGSVLAGGSSGPYGDDKAPAAKWLALADQFYDASVDKSNGGVGIPMLWGIDAVHGHANIVGATIFPHNIGLGAAHDPVLIERVGVATAKEIRVTGQEWTFAPTVTVPQDYRWGRAYEGYSSDPKLVSSYVGAMVRGLQGPPAGKIASDKVLASTKHFLADGGTHNGVDQGDAQISEIELRDIHGAPYGPAITNGVGTVMASFSSWQGKKMTGNKSLLTGVLKDRMGFGGFTVSDWNAHGQVEGCTNADCPQALMAGVDMYMAPDSWKPIYENLLREAKSGQIPMARIDEAVTRILRVKARLGLFEAGKPSARPLAGQWSLLGAPAHRAIAREAVRKSLVLLKNQGVLPLKAGGRLLVAGDGVDDISRQSGGWTISWQGTGVTNADFPGATSLGKGFADAVKAGRGTTELSPDGSFKTRPDAAVVIFGEKPYAEFQGDRKSLQLDPELTGPFETMRKLKAQGIPVVAVMITGRPLYVNPALNLADAFVVAWLPGSEGAGVADVLVGNKAGAKRFDFTGTLPTAWPKTANMADGALYPFGYGLKYGSPKKAWTALPEKSGAGAGDARVWFANGVPAASWSLAVTDENGGQQTRITAVPAKALDGRVTITATDHIVQEGARRFVIDSGKASIQLGTFDPLDIARESNGDVMLLVTIKVDKAPVSASVGMKGGATALLPATPPVSANYVRYGLPLKCFAAKGVDMTKVTAPFVLTLEGPTDLSIAEVRLGSDAEVPLRCP
ncbi:MAG: exo 1,3/1,4-beta-D-glucan glucohydrolase [Sphingobium sp.]|nr:exo 1,3/1,4-beta-D-glucan glucohydrolase [Sphingobium sp.]